MHKNTLLMEQIINDLIERVENVFNTKGKNIFDKTFIF